MSGTSAPAAEMTAAEFYRDEGPETCAEVDISYWGDE